MSPTDQHPLEMMVLNAAFDAGGAIEIAALRKSIPADGRTLRKAIDAQHRLGNLRLSDGPITLTASAKAAVAAGRAHRPMFTLKVPARRLGKSMAARLRQIVEEISV